MMQLTQIAIQKFLRMLNTKSPWDPATALTPWYICKGNKGMCLHKHHAPVFTEHYSQQLRVKATTDKECLSVDEWSNTLWYIYTMEYHSALKRNEEPAHATVWTNLENTALTERSQAQKGAFCMTPFI